MDAVQLALEGIDDARRLTTDSPTLRIVNGADEMEQAHMDARVGVLIGLEGGHAIGASLAVLRSMFQLGARFVSITGLGCTTPWAAAAKNSLEFVMDESLPQSLTTFGEVRKLLIKMIFVYTYILNAKYN